MRRIGWAPTLLLATPLAHASASSSWIDLPEAAVPPDVEVFTGSFVHEGHGPTPGATTTDAVTVEVWRGETSACVVWRVTSWTDTLCRVGDDLFRDEGRGWQPVAPTAGDWLTAQFFAVAPDILAGHLLADPARLHATSEGLLWAMGEGMATVAGQPGDDTLTLTLPRAHPVFGDVSDEITWTRSASAPSVEIVRAEANTRWRLQLVAADGRPSGAPPSPPPPSTWAHQEVSPGVHVFDLPEADSRTVLVVQGDEGVLFDPPLSSDIGARLVQAAKAQAPQVRTWSVVVSHHHPHYTGGLRPWARMGATIHAPAAIRDWLLELLASDRPLSPDDPPVPNARVVGVSRPMKLAGGAVALRPIDATSGHTEAFVLSYLTASRTLYIADLGWWKEGTTAPRLRGNWPEDLGRWKPTHAISAFPLENAKVRWDWTM